MSLSTNLLTQFVKVTNDTKKEKKETTTYGTIEVDGDVTYVILDGATGTKIPVADGTDESDIAYTSSLHDGDRVTVTIKNHKVIITGNLTYPSGSDADLVNLADILATQGGYIKNLEAENVVIEQRLAASEGNFGTLNTQVTNISEELNATKAKVGILEANSLTVTIADIRYASISSLDAINTNVLNLSAAHGEFKDVTTQRLDVIEGTLEDLDVGTAEIGSLRAEIADINTLIFGSATGDTIHSSFSNAVIAQLGDAQIKSAMIESISASKITAGDIITNNVRVKSEDGLLLISDETIQISDRTRVRVQIGKDAVNDYSINIWDQNGNLMFSKGGITDSAIKEAIIRNDMVSDTANIHASKLDIDSLFEEINGSTNTIKSTKVYLDENKQSLDIAFKALSTTVTTQGTSITSQGTAISTIQGQISSKIWQQDINTATNTMSTQYFTLEQSLNSYKTTVGQTYATISAMNSSIEQLSNRITANVTATTDLGTRMAAVELSADGLTTRLSDLTIGGRNLLKNSRLIELISNNSNIYPISCTEMTEKGVRFYRVKRTDIITYPSTLLSVYSSIARNSFAYGEMVGKQVTLSFKARVSHPMNGTFMDFTYGGAAVVDFGKTAEQFTTDWKTYYITIDSFPDMTERDGIRWNPYTFNIPSANLADFYLDVRDYKFEFGNKPTDWTPAPEDVDSSISTASKTATDYLNLSNAGLIVGNMTATTLGKNVLIGSNDIRIRTGTTDNAIFGADIIELAKDNASATISMLNGAFKIYYDANLSEAGLGVYGKASDGSMRLAFQPVNENDNLTLGWGGYNAKKNCTNIYGHNINLVAGNDMAFECDDWKINIDGNLFAKASNASFVELIGLSSDDNTAIGHGGYTAAIGKTNIYGNKIQHIVNTSSGSASYKPYYEAGDSFETEWYGAGFISSSSKVVYFSIPLAKPVIGSSTPNVTVTNATTGTGGLQIRQDSNYVFGSTSSSKATPSSYSAKVMGNGNFVQIEATMANSTNAINNAPCGINANIKITFS